MNTSLHHWHRRSYSIECLNSWICPPMYILTRERIQTKPASNWLHGRLEICGDMRPLLTVWQPLTSAQNTNTWQLCQAFRQWSWEVSSLYMRSMWCLWICLPQMWWRQPSLIADGMRTSPGLIKPSESQTLHVDTFQSKMNHPNACFRCWHCASGSRKDSLLMCSNGILLREFNLLDLWIWNKVAYRYLQNHSLAIG